MLPIALFVTFFLMWTKETSATNCGGGYKCPGDETCCQSRAGPPSCCVFPNATCCDDHVHCCPPSYPICDLEHQRCLSSSNKEEQHAHIKEMIKKLYIDAAEDENGIIRSWLPWFGNMVHTQKLRGTEDDTRKSNRKEVMEQWFRKVKIELSPQPDWWPSSLPLFDLFAAWSEVDDDNYVSPTQG